MSLEYQYYFKTAFMQDYTIEKSRFKTETSAENSYGRGRKNLLGSEERVGTKERNKN